MLSGFYTLDSVVKSQLVGCSPEAGHLYFLQSGRDTNGVCRFLLVKSFMVFARFILVELV